MKFPVDLMNTQSHMSPCIRISPFTGHNMEELLDNGGDDHARAFGLSSEFWLDSASSLQVLRSGRSALRCALIASGLASHDSVIIITTTGGHYVSSCVTETIDEVCQWSRQLMDNTRAALVIHEFGFPCALPKEVAERGLTIIEDCAYALGTRIEGGDVGHFGDFAIYSLTKYLPLPIGGLLVSRGECPAISGKDLLTENAIDFVARCIANSRAKYALWNQRRRENWNYFGAQIEKHGFRTYFDLHRNVVPGVFVANLPPNVDGASIKARCVGAGIESTEYYGQGGFYFPVHQCLTNFERDYVLHHFLSKR